MSEIPQPIHNQQLGKPTREVLQGQTIVIDHESPALEVPGSFQDPGNVLADKDLVAVIGAGTYGSPDFKQVAIVRGQEGWSIAGIVPAGTANPSEPKPKANTLSSAFAVMPGTNIRFNSGFGSMLGNLDDGVDFTLSVGEDSLFRIRDGQTDGAASRTGLQVISAGLKPEAEMVAGPKVHDVVAPAVGRAAVLDAQTPPAWSVKEKRPLTETGAYDKVEVDRLEKFILAQANSVDNPQVKREARIRSVETFLAGVQADAANGKVSKRFAGVVSAYAAGNMLGDYTRTERGILQKAGDGLKSLPPEVFSKVLSKLWGSSTEGDSVFDTVQTGGAERAAELLVDDANALLSNSDVSEADKLYGTSLLAVAAGLRGKHTTHRLTYYMRHAQLAPHMYI